VFGEEPTEQEIKRDCNTNSKRELNKTFGFEVDFDRGFGNRNIQDGQVRAAAA
jgi:hypothetical protein